MEREFDLGVVISIASGRTLAPYYEIQKCLKYLTGRPETFTGEIPRGEVFAAKAYIINKYPQINGVGEGANVANEAEIREFVNKQKSIYGNSLSLSPMVNTIAPNVAEDNGLEM